MLAVLLSVGGAASAQWAFPSLGGDEYSPQGGVSLSVGQLAVEYACEKAVSVQRRTLSVQEGVQQTYPQEELAIAGAGEPGFTVEVFPNPTEGQLSVALGGQPAWPVSLELLTIEGRTLMAIALDHELRSELDLSECAAGSYMLRVKDAVGQRLFKIVKIR